LGFTVDGGELRTELGLLEWIHLRGGWQLRGEELSSLGGRKKRKIRERKRQKEEATGK